MIHGIIRSDGKLVPAEIADPNNPILLPGILVSEQIPVCATRITELPSPIIYSALCRLELRPAL
jgi:hypothetical protein